MARGTTLVRDVLPMLEARLDSSLDAHAAERLADMRERYAGYIARERRRLELDVGGPDDS
jgi:CRP-like cAMP-binding protein